MASAVAEDTRPLAKGEYAPATVSDRRSPCPMVNCLANHGYISRDGRDIRRADLAAAVEEVGIAPTLAAMLTYPIYIEHVESKTTASTSPPPSLTTKLWDFLQHPVMTTLGRFGMRQPGQVDEQGHQVLDLDQLATPGTVEHDISLTRRDHAQGDNLSRQPDLIKDLLACSADGKVLTMEDLASFRKKRIETQTRDNPGRTYAGIEHQLACGEIAFVLKVLGDGQQVPCEYVRAVFQEERLPVGEGWKTRGAGSSNAGWWPWSSSSSSSSGVDAAIGILELNSCTSKVKKVIGLSF